MDSVLKAVVVFVCICFGALLLFAGVGALIFAYRPAAPIYVYTENDGRPPRPANPYVVPQPDAPWIPNPNYVPRRPQGSLGSPDVGNKGAKETPTK